MDTAIRVQILDETDCISHCTNTLGKGMNPIILPPAMGNVVVIPRTILPRRKRRCALSAAGTRKPEEEKEARGVTCFMEENKISLCEVARFDEDKRLSLKWKTAAFC